MPLYWLWDNIVVPRFKESCKDKFFSVDQIKIVLKYKIVLLI